MRLHLSGCARFALRMRLRARDGSIALASGPEERQLIQPSPQHLSAALLEIPNLGHGRLQIGVSLAVEIAGVKIANSLTIP
jgi:hypothetical protein